ncbi:hypothetical protein ACFL59_16265, partial [Planctomycetota bacterium]
YRTTPLPQLSGDEPPGHLEELPLPVVKAVRLSSSEDVLGIEAYRAAHAILVDASRPGTYGGTGTLADWDLARKARLTGQPIVLAGGIGPGNIHAALLAVGPAALDVCSSVELRPGVKDSQKLDSLFRAVRAASVAAAEAGLYGMDFQRQRVF